MEICTRILNYYTSTHKMVIKLAKKFIRDSIQTLLKGFFYKFSKKNKNKKMSKMK